MVGSLDENNKSNKKRVRDGDDNNENNSNCKENTAATSVGSFERFPKRQRKRPDYLSEQLLVADDSTASSKLYSHFVANNSIDIYPKRQPLPTRDTNGFLHFSDFPEFIPNLTPKEVLQMGSFGGTYFRIITSGVTSLTYHNAWEEFPEDWFDGLNIKTQVASQKYDIQVNRYKVECGGDLHMWESAGWITEADPYGWFQWYCRFYLGRRCSDDNRQIKRALGVMGKTGRWRRNLINKVLSSHKNPEKVVDDNSISPKIRQLLQHWGYKLSINDLKKR